METKSKCPHCQKQGFELVPEQVEKSNYWINILRCVHCKTAISAFEEHHIGNLIKELRDEL